jgi:hypothetical protein
MLIGNGARLTSNPMRQYCGVGVTNDMHVPIPSTGSLRNSRAIFGKLASIPKGKQAPYSWLMSFKSGDMTSFSEVSGSGDVTLDLASGINLLGTATGSGTLTPDLSAIAHILAALTGSGDITYAVQGCPLWLGPSFVSGSGTITTADSTLLTFCEANLSGYGDLNTPNLELIVEMIATLTGQGDLSSAMELLTFLAASLSGAGSISTATLESLAQLSSSLSGGGTVTSAQVDCLAWFAATVLGQGDVEASARCDMHMEAEITSAGEMVTAQSCAQAVWSAMASSFNDAGTTGNKLNSAAAAGDPWTAELPGSYSEGQAGAMMGFMVKVLVNKREIKKVGDTWTLFVYDDDGATPILSKALKDISGAQIADLAAGLLAQEEASDV